MFSSDSSASGVPDGPSFGFSRSFVDVFYFLMIDHFLYPCFIRVVFKLFFF